MDSSPFSCMAESTESTESTLPPFEIFPHLSKDMMAKMPFALIGSYYGENYKTQLVRHQIESFNHFIRHQMPGTVEQFNPIIISCDDEYNSVHDCYGLQIYIYLENVKVGLPIVTEPDGSTKPMYPAEACMRNFAYGSKVTVDMRVQYHVRKSPAFELEIITSLFKDVILCNRMPIMVRSEGCMLSQPSVSDPRITGECMADCGGYFIIKGSEKTVLTQIHLTENQIHTFYDKSSPNRAWYAEIESTPLSKFISPKKLEMFIYEKENALGHPIFVTIQRIRMAIPLYVLFRYYGAVSDKYITEFIVHDIHDPSEKAVCDFLAASILEANMCMSTEDAISRITDDVYFIYPDHMTDPQVRREKKTEYVRNIMHTDFLPHCPTPTHKLILLGIMARQLILTRMGKLEVTDRDSYNYKRVYTAGSLINNLFRNNYNQMVKSMKKFIKKEMKLNHWKTSNNYQSIITEETIPRIVKSSIIENGIKRPLASGDFSLPQSSQRKVGVAQMLSRLTFAATISHSRRLNTHVTKNGEMIKPRKVNPTSWGFICPVESPEGECVGLVNSMSCFTHITIQSEHRLIPDILRPHLTDMTEDITSSYISMRQRLCLQIRDNIPLSPALLRFQSRFYYLVSEQINRYCLFPVHRLSKRVMVFVNNVYVGIARDALALYKWLKNQKAAGILNPYISILFDRADRKIYICTEGGRLTRPVIRLIDGKSPLTNQVVLDLIHKKIGWDDLLLTVPGRPAVLEYIEPREQEECIIAMTSLRGNCTDIKTRPPVYTHCEIHPSVIFGVIAACIPFPEHNQSPRNTYQSAMGKQSMGVYALNHDMRIDKSAYYLSYAGRPLVATRFMDISRMNQTPAGTQVIIAIASYSGYNQEDSLIINKSAIDRGLFSASIFHTEKDEEKSQQDSFIRMRPDPEITRGMRFGKLGKYNKLDDSGFVPEGTLVENNDIIIGKVIRAKKPRGNNLNEEVLNDYFPNHKYEDHSKKLRTYEPVYIYKNFCGRNGDNYNFAVVQTLTYRKPDIGDKFASRQAQKGTCGIILPEEDMPFMADGTKPDIILNPHAIPSRMTIAYMMEVLMGKVLVEEGTYGDGTFHSNQSITDIAKDLQAHGYQSHGDELMYNGMTGEQMETSIFTGPIYYQRLKHMVNDKMHAREMGPPVSLTRQPMEGRSRDGGFRIGEMERDVIISHGATALCLDRLSNVSDKYYMWCCKACGRIASVNTGAPQNVFMPEKTMEYNRPIYLCKMCDNTTRFARVTVPYACKLLFQELEVANVLPRLITSD